jgi:cystathionine beta-lyase/cystathionine gamma-synthase
MRRYQIEFTYVDTSDLAATAKAFTRKTKLLFLETPTNPVMRPHGHAEASALAHRHQAIVAVDNTFASPCLQRPLALGADLVVHSTTKYLNGHSDIDGGVVVAVRDEDIEWLGFVQNARARCLSPMDSWLVLRGTKTLALRMAQHSANGMALAEFPAAAPAGQAGVLPRSCRATRSTRSPAPDADGFGGMIVVRGRIVRRSPLRAQSLQADGACREPRRR